MVTSPRRYDWPDCLQPYLEEDQEGASRLEIQSSLTCRLDLGSSKMVQNRN